MHHFAAIRPLCDTVLPVGRSAGFRPPRRMHAGCSRPSIGESDVPELVAGILGERVDELMKREENSEIFEGLKAASRRVDQARAALADIERQEAEVRGAQEKFRRLQNQQTEIAEAERDLSEARKMIEEAERSLTLDELELQNMERLESAKVAFVSSISGGVACLPLSLHEAASLPELIVRVSVVLISSALFGVMFRYAVRRDIDNIQLKTGTVAAFGFVKGLASLGFRNQIDPSFGGLTWLAVDGLVAVAENSFIFLSAAIALDFCFKMRILSPFPMRDK